MQVLQSSNNNEEISTNIKISSNFQILNDIFLTTISELNSVRNDLSDLQKKSAFLERKNEQLIENFKTVLSNLNANFNLKDVCTQSQEIEFRDFGTNCNFESPVVDVEQNIETEILNSNIEDTEVVIDEYIAEIEVTNIEIESNDKIDNVDENNVIFEPIQTEQTPIEIQPIESEPVKQYTKTDMLIYLARYKINFLKFLQCNRNNIEQIAGGCPELIRSFSCNSGNEEKVETKRKVPSGKSKRCKTKSISDIKPGVIDTGDNFVDPSLKSSLYDDLDFHDASEKIDLKNNTTDSVAVVVHHDVAKAGGEKRINTMGVQSKMNLLKSRADGRISKKAELWKTEITNLDSRHESHFPAGSEQHEPIKKERDKKERDTQELMKPLDTVFTSRMKDRLSKRKTEIDTSNPATNPTQTLTIVKYDLSTADDPSFQLDSKPEKCAQPPNPDKPDKKPSPKKKVSSKAKSPPKPESDAKIDSGDKSRHKHKHSSKKKPKKIAKDLEDGEIV